MKRRGRRRWGSMYIPVWPSFHFHPSFHDRFTACGYTLLSHSMHHHRDHGCGGPLVSTSRKVCILPSKRYLRRGIHQIGTLHDNVQNPGASHSDSCAHFDLVDRLHWWLSVLLFRQQSTLLPSVSVRGPCQHYFIQVFCHPSDRPFPLGHTMVFRIRLLHEDQSHAVAQHRSTGDGFACRPIRPMQWTIRSVSLLGPPSSPEHFHYQCSEHCQ